MVRLRTIVLLFAAPAFCSVTLESGSNRDALVKVNVEAFDWAVALIAQGRFVADRKGAWATDHPNRSRENDFVRNHGFAEYAKWYLALDERHASNRKTGYKFPFGDFWNVHRCGLLAVKARAHEYGYQEVEDAATKLLEMIESASPRSQKCVD